jgi:hypothetical protein
LDYDAGNNQATIPGVTVTEDFALSGDITPTPSLDQDDYTPTGLATSPVVRVNPSASINISGLTAGSDGEQKTLLNASTDYILVLTHEDTASTAANRFDFGVEAFPYIMLPGEAVTLWYDSTATRWRYAGGSHGSGIAGQFNQFTEFYGVGTSGSTGDWMGGCSITGGSAACSASAVGVNTTERSQGVMGLTTGTTSTGRAYMAGMNNANSVPASGGLLFAARVSVPTLSTSGERYQIYCGFHDGAGGTSPTDGVYWLYDDSVTTDWRYAVEGAGTPSVTTAASFTVTATVNNIIGFWVNPAWTRVDYFYSIAGTNYVVASGAALTQTGANIPTGTEFVTPACGINKTVGATARTMDIDWIGWRFGSAGTR